MTKEDGNGLEDLIKKKEKRVKKKGKLIGKQNKDRMTST